jgi:hypothetical protein
MSGGFLVSMDFTTRDSILPFRNFGGSIGFMQPESSFSPLPLLLGSSIKPPEGLQGFGMLDKYRSSSQRSRKEQLQVIRRGDEKHIFPLIH